MATQSSSSPAKKAKLGKWGVVGGLIAFVFALGFIGNLFTQGGAGSTESGVSGNIIPLLMLFALLIFSFVLKGWKRAVALIGIVAILLSPLLLKPSIKTVAQGYGISEGSEAQWQSLGQTRCPLMWEGTGKHQVFQGWCVVDDESGVYRVTGPVAEWTNLQGGQPVTVDANGIPCSNWHGTPFMSECQAVDPAGANYGQMIVKDRHTGKVWALQNGQTLEIPAQAGIAISVRGVDMSHSRQRFFQDVQPGGFISVNVERQLVPPAQTASQ